MFLLLTLGSGGENEFVEPGSGLVDVDRYLVNNSCVLVKDVTGGVILKEDDTLSSFGVRGEAHNSAVLTTDIASIVRRILCCENFPSGCVNHVVSTADNEDEDEGEECEGKCELEKATQGGVFHGVFSFQEQ